MAVSWKSLKSLERSVKIFIVFCMCAMLAMARRSLSSGFHHIGKLSLVKAACSFMEGFQPVSQCRFSTIERLIYSVVGSIKLGEYHFRRGEGEELGRGNHRESTILSYVGHHKFITQCQTRGSSIYLVESKGGGGG